ncbi:MAG: hypothetical protein EHM56_04840, partial [Chloroflexi bacterium]
MGSGGSSVPDDPRQFSFWSGEERRFWDKVAPSALSILLAGGTSGESALPPGVRVLVDWDVFNDQAVAYLRQYRLGTLADVNRHTQERAVKLVDDWIQSGESFDVLTAKLAPLFGKERAERIAVTEVTRLYAEGNQIAWRASGLVSGNRWNTAVDEKVCAICRPLHGVV